MKVVFELMANGGHHHVGLAHDLEQRHIARTAEGDDEFSKKRAAAHLAAGERRRGEGCQAGPNGQQRLLGQGEIAMLRIATLDGVQPIALHELNEVFTKMLSGAASKKFTRGGVKTAAEILNFVGTTNEATVIENVRSVDPDLAQKIQDQMFVFDNITTIDDRGIQLILREIQSESLIIAMKGASEEIREKIFRNMSQRAAEMLREDLESKGPVKLSDVEAEQKEILKVARRLSDEGQISLGPKGDEAYV